MSYVLESGYNTTGSGYNGTNSAYHHPDMVYDHVGVVHSGGLNQAFNSWCHYKPGYGSYCVPESFYGAIGYGYNGYHGLLFFVVIWFVFSIIYLGCLFRRRAKLEYGSLALFSFGMFQLNANLQCNGSLSSWGWSLILTS